MAKLRSIVINIGWLSAAQFFDYLLRAVIGILVARHLGVQQFGSFAPSLSLVLMAAVFTDLGLRMTIVKSGSSQPNSLTGVFTVASGAKAVLLTFVYLALLLLAAVLNLGAQEFVLVAILGAGVLIGNFSELVLGVLQAKEKMALMSAVTVSFRLVLLASVLAVILSGGDVVAVTIGYSAAHIISAFIALIIVIPQLRRTPMTSQPIKLLLGQSLQFGVVTVLMPVFMQADIVMLRLLHADGQTMSGLYAVSYRLVALLYVVPNIIQSAVIPRLYRYAAEPDRLRVAYKILFRWSLVTSATLGAITLALAPTLISLLFGTEFLAAAPALAILALNLPLHQLSYVCGDTLYALKRQGRRAISLIICVVFNIGINILVIPIYGAVGAAWTTVISGSILLILLLAGVHKAFPLNIFREGFAPLAAAALAALVIWSLKDMLPIALQFVLAGLVALGVPVLLLLFRYIKLGDLIRPDNNEDKS